MKIYEALGLPIKDTWNTFMITHEKIHAKDVDLSL